MKGSEGIGKKGNSAIHYSSAILARKSASSASPWSSAGCHWSQEEAGFCLPLSRHYSRRK